MSDFLQNKEITEYHLSEKENEKYLSDTKSEFLMDLQNGLGDEMVKFISEKQKPIAKKNNFWYNLKRLFG